MDNLKENKPTADILMFSMRSMGYSFESAIADVIDNSISANAHEIILNFPVDPSDCFVTIFDDGCGMTNDELFDAMKYGSENKRSGRTSEDLGRFGLGLKSASLSQCRKLTVASKKDGHISAYIWDLDVIIKKKDWFVIECTENQIKKIKNISYLNKVETGTIVVWEDFDIIEKSSNGVYGELSQYQETTANYLSLIFHRYLNKPGNEKIHIKINNYELIGLDPFLENHPKTDIRRQIELPIKDYNGVEQIVTVQPYVLPFQKDLSAEDKKVSGGIESYRKKQGFYVYRNERLIVWGTWFGKHKDELTKYARIRVDIPNTLDDIWGIDIKKQNAKIPSVIQKRLTKAVDEAMDLAVKKQKHRGRIEKVDDEIDYIWDRIKCRGDNFTYKINRNSKIFDLIKDNVTDEVWSEIDMILEEVENSVPYQQIYIDKSQNKVDEDITDERLAEIKAKAEMLLNMALRQGNLDKDSAVNELLKHEPFNNYPQLKDVL